MQNRVYSYAHVDNAVKVQDSLKGIGLKSPTTVYSHASTGSKKLKSYAQGTILNYQTFSSNWYQAKVYINGKPTTGYIHTSHVEGLYQSQKSLDGVALKTPTNVYGAASKNAAILTKYTKGNLVLFITLSPNWFQTQVSVNGKSYTGYLHKDDVNTERLITTTTSYSTNFNR